MPVDLRVHGIANRKSLLVMEESLVLLEHSQFSDRIHKIRYENIETILVWRKTPWLKMAVTAVILGAIAYIPFVGSWSLEDRDTQVYLLTALGFFAVLEALFLFRKNHFIRIIHSGQRLDLKVSAFPWKARGFVDKVRAHAGQRQEKLRERRNAAREHGEAKSDPDHLPPPWEESAPAITNPQGIT